MCDTKCFKEVAVRSEGKVPCEWTEFPRNHSGAPDSAE